jgi:uridine phosphorylase
VPVSPGSVSTMAEVFHLGLTKQLVDGATLAIIPGDPARVERIARHLDNPVPLASTREFTSYRGLAAGEPVIVCSTGIGGPSTSIAVEELAQLGVRTFIRVGTTGAIQPDLEVGTLVVTNAAVRLDGASRDFAPLEYPAVSDFDCTTALVAAARAAGFEPRVGITASADTFYTGQERYDTVAGRVTRDLEGSLAEWQALGVLNYEMESATLFTMCATNGWRAGCIAGAIVNRHDQEIPDPEVMEEIEENSIRVVVDAARLLLS